MKNITEYSSYLINKESKNYIDQNSNINCTAAQPIWTLEHVYIIILEKIYKK